MAKKEMDLRGQLADLRNILQVQSLKIEKLEQTEKNMQNIRDKVNNIVSTLDWLDSAVHRNIDNIHKQWDNESKQDNDIKLLFKQYSEITNRLDGINDSIADLYDEWHEYERRG